MDNDRCPKGVENEQRIVALEHRIQELQLAVSEIRNDLLGRLPNWATVTISLLASLVVGLAVAFAKG
jgi:hypothetical protein